MLNTDTEYDALPNYWFSHSLSAIFTAMIKHGIAITVFEEYAHDISNVFKPLESLNKVPLSYILVGERR
jgi:hypothetical protein